METTEVSFTAKDVMTLRQKTGMGMMDCKKSLKECNGDMAEAEQWLREHVKGKMETRTERATGETQRVTVDAAAPSGAATLTLESILLSDDDGATSSLSMATGTLTVP